MQIFSRVCAKLDCIFAALLPPEDNLKNFIGHLLSNDHTNFEVLVDEKDGGICISGSWIDMTTIESALQNFVEARKDEVQQIVTEDIPLETIHKATIQEDSSESDEELKENEDCLNIEVLHSENGSLDKNIKFSCKLCSFQSQRESHYIKHMSLHKTKSTIHRCEHCSFSTCSITRLRRHQVSHSSNALTCSNCNYSTDDPKLLARHQRVKHKTADEPNDSSETVHQCPMCQYQTTRSYLYQRHMKVHSAEESKGGPNLFICSQCDYRTSRKMHFLRHVKDVHRQWRPYLCHHCGKAFKRPDALKQHSVLHAAPGAPDSKLAHFQCRPCGKICRSRAHLKEHQAVHSSERSFLCEICGASFKTRSVQRKHVATLHNNPRAFPCALCSKRFNTNYALRRHMKQHPSVSEETPNETGQSIMTITLPTSDTTVAGVVDEAVTLTVKLDGQVDSTDLLYLGEHVNEA